MSVTATAQNSFPAAPKNYPPGEAAFVSKAGVPGAGDSRTAAGGPPESAAKNDFFGADGLSFSDLLDVLNPLQHIPVIGDLYRSVSGDEISPGARIAGGTLFGGPLGFVGALANVVIEDATGRDIGGNVLAQFSGDDAADGTAAGAAPAAAPSIPAGPANGAVKLASVQSHPAPAAAAASAFPDPRSDLPTPPPYPPLLPGMDPAPPPRLAGPAQHLPASGPASGAAAFPALLSVGDALGQNRTAGGEMPPPRKGTTAIPG